MPPLGLASRLLRPLVTGAGAVGGGAYGALTADPEKGQSPLLRGLGGAAMGGLIVPAGLRSVSRLASGVPWEHRKRIKDYSESATQGITDPATGKQAEFVYRDPRKTPYGLEEVPGTRPGEKIANWTYFSMLSSPDTILRGSFGAIGGALNAAVERGLEGLATGDLNKIKQGGRIVKSLMSGGTKADPRGWRLYGQAVGANEDEFRRLYQRVTGAVPEDFASRHTKGQGVGVLFAAPDLAAIQAMKEGGFTAAEAARYTLAGEPQTRTGRWILNKLRQGREMRGIPEFTAIQSAPFARVGILGFEKGLERFLGVGEIVHQAARKRRAFDLEAAKAGIPGFDPKTGKWTRPTIDPEAAAEVRARLEHLHPSSALDEAQAELSKLAQSEQYTGARQAFEDAMAREGKGKSQAAWHRYWEDLEKVVIHEGGIPELSTGLQRGIQQAVGFGAGVAGYKSADYLDPRAGLVAATLTGPAFFPYQVGRQFRKKVEREGLPSSAVGWAAAGPTAMGSAFKEFSPLGFEPLGLFTRPMEELSRRVIPAAMADVATAIDPAHGRETSRERLRDLKLRLGEDAPDPKLAPWLYRTPGLRETLPETFSPVDVFGRPRFDHPEAFPGTEGPGAVSQIFKGVMKTVAPSLRAAEPPAQNLRDPQMRQLHEMGIDMQAPGGQVTLPRVGLPLTPTGESVAGVQRLRGRSREMAADIITRIPELQRMPDSPRKRLLVDLLMTRIQGLISRRLNQLALPTALQQGARLPGVMARSRMETDE
jgi:hypothetical protein